MAYTRSQRAATDGVTDEVNNASDTYVPSTRLFSGFSIPPVAFASKKNKGKGKQLAKEPKKKNPTKRKTPEEIFNLNRPANESRVPRKRAKVEKTVISRSSYCQRYVR